MPIISLNPTTEIELARYEPLTEGELTERITRARRAFADGWGIPLARRLEWLARAATLLEDERDRLGRLSTTEMGKPLEGAVEEISKCARGCLYYFENAERHLTPRPEQTDADESFVEYQPLGVVLGVMPWNFPFWQVFRFSAPALAAGNVVLLKHASNVPQCALAIEDLWRRAGVPEGFFQALLIPAASVPSVIRDGRVAAVSLTGSDAAGSSVAAEAGKQIMKCVLELGGSDPFIVMPSVPLDEAVRVAVRARTMNNGQSCVAAKRFIIHRSIASQFVHRLVARMEELRVGNPLERDTDIGPLATREILATVTRQVELTVEAGAKLWTGGRRLDRPGFFFPPTVLSDIPEGSPGWLEEVFGPVALVFVAEDIDDALRIANQSRYGLGSCLWSADREEQRRFIERSQAGLCFINGMVASDPRLPFGGVKRSGYGRELGVEGIREFVNAKTVWIRHAPDAKKHGETLSHNE